MQNWQTAYDRFYNPNIGVHHVVNMSALVIQKLGIDGLKFGRISPLGEQNKKKAFYAHLRLGGGSTRQFAYGGKNDKSGPGNDQAHNERYVWPSKSKI